MPKLLIGAGSLFRKHTLQHQTLKPQINEKQNHNDGCGHILYDIQGMICV